MWWRRSIFLGVALLLTACGFEAVYADRSNHAVSTAGLLSAIVVDAPKGRMGELLKAKLEDHFNPTAQPSPAIYKLKAGIKTTAEPFVIESDGTASRYTITITSPFTLTALANGHVLEKGVIRRAVSYNVSEDDDYATFITENNMLERGMVELAEDYKMRISALMVKKNRQYGQRR